MVGYPLRSGQYQAPRDEGLPVTACARRVQQYRLRLAKTDIGSVAARLVKGEARSADVSQQVLGTERARGKPVDLVHEPDKGNHGATGKLHGGPTGVLQVYDTGDHGAASSGEKNDRHGQGRQNTLSTSSSRPSAKGAAVGQTAPGPKRGVLEEWRKQQARARQRRVAAAARAPRTVASVLGDSVAARCAKRSRAKRALAQARNWGLPAQPPANLGLQGVRMAKDRGGRQWGAGAKGQMGAKAKARTGKRHAGKPTFGVYNSGGLTNVRWNIVRTHLAPKMDVLGLPEFSSPLGEWKGEKFAAEARGKLIVGEKPKRGDGSGSAAILLSPRMTACIEEGSEGSCGSRIVYVRLKVGVNYLFVICAYIEYWDRGPGKGEQAKRTHRRMQDVINSQAKTGDCLVVLTDANAKLGPTQDGLAGEYCVSRKPNEAGKALLAFMRENKLVAANTQFKPRRQKHSKHKGGSQAHPGCITYRPFKNKCGTSSQIDYILVSSRWFSSVESCRVLWEATLLAQSEFRVDHGCVVARWQCRVRRAKTVVKRDPKSYLIPEVGLRCENAARKEVGLTPLTLLQFQRKLSKPKVGGWSTQQMLFGDAVDKHGADQYVKQATPVLILPAPPELDDTTPVDEETLQARDLEVCELYATMVKACKAAWAELEPMPKRPYEKVMTDRTRGILDERRRVVQSGKAQRGDWAERRKGFAKAVRESCKRDWQEWVSRQADDMMAAAANGDSAKVAQIVKVLGGRKPSFCSKSPTRAPKVSASGKIEWGKGPQFESALDLANAWRKFAEDKFAATYTEARRAEMEDLGPAAGRANDSLSLQEKEEGLKVLKKMRSPGRDGIPIEMYQQSPVCRELLFDLLDKMWLYELVPEDLIQGSFVTIFKQKAGNSPEDMTKYRFICLLNHASKLLSVCLLKRLMKETDWFLPTHQAGFRQGRGTRDNIWILSQVMDACIDRGQEMVTVFIDFVAAFDSVSHKFLDETLAEAKASKKSRAMWRACYTKASAAIRVRQNDGSGTDTYSDKFGIDRGVVQGAIDSPWYFILALELIFRESDSEGGIDLDLPCGKILRLEYADDAALLCNNDTEATTRLTGISVHALKKADMDISRPKTEGQDVRKATRLSIPTEAEITDALGDDAFNCKDCTRPFSAKRSLESHHRLSSNGCKWRECDDGCGKTDPMGPIYDVRGGGDVLRFFATEKFDDNHSTRQLRSGNPPATKTVWIPESIVTQMPFGPEKIDEFFKGQHRSGEYWPTDASKTLWDLHAWSDPRVRHGSIDDPNDEARCIHCSQIAVSSDDIHSEKDCSRYGGVRARSSLTVREVHRRWRETQGPRVRVKMGSEEIKTSETFVYLGHLFTSDNDQVTNIDQRIGRAKSVFKSLHHIWRSKNISISLKRRLYMSSTISVCTYGHETWKLTKRTIAKLNGFNAGCLATIYIGHRTVTADERVKCRKEQSVAHGTVSDSGIHGKRMLDITAVLRARRLTWLGHILRLPATEMLRQVLLNVAWPNRHEEGGLLMDAPEHTTLSELVCLAGSHATDEGEEAIFRWRQRVAEIIPEDHRTKSVPQQRTDRFVVKPTALTREEKDARIIAENVRQLLAMPVNSWLIYSDGGVDGNGAGGVWGASGFGVCVTRKGIGWTVTSEPNILEEYFGPVVTDAADPYYLGATRGTNNTGELNGLSTALLHLRNDGGHEPAIICYDSKYAANITDGTWQAKSNIEAARINRELYEAEHLRRDGGVILSHCKAHSKDVLNDVADANVQHGKRPCVCDKQPCVCYSRLRLSRSETDAEKVNRGIARANRPAIAAVTTSDTSASARAPSLRLPTATPADTPSANSSDPVHALLPTVTDDDPPDVNGIATVTDPIHGGTMHQQHAHPLFRADLGAGFFCNMCDASDPPGQRWRCDACDYDICHVCWLCAKPADAGNIVTGAAAH